MALRWDIDHQRFRDSSGRFVSKKRGLKSKTARKQYTDDLWYQSSGAAFFGIGQATEEQRVEYEAPIKPIISEIGAADEDEEDIDFSTRKGGSLAEYIERYVYNAADFDPDQDDDTDAEF